MIQSQTRGVNIYSTPDHIFNFQATDYIHCCIHLTRPGTHSLSNENARATHRFSQPPPLIPIVPMTPSLPAQRKSECTHHLPLRLVSQTSHTAGMKADSRGRFRQKWPVDPTQLQFTSIKHASQLRSSSLPCCPLRDAKCFPPRVARSLYCVL